jgi:hypothetical protein
MTDCRHAEWDEEWRHGIAPEDRFTGWSSLDTVAKRASRSIAPGIRLVKIRFGAMSDGGGVAGWRFKNSLRSELPQHDREAI